MSPKSQSHLAPLGLLQFVDLFFQFQNERIKLRNVGRVVALFVSSEAEQVCDAEPTGTQHFVDTLATVVGILGNCGALGLFKSSDWCGSMST